MVGIAWHSMLRRAGIPFVVQEEKKSLQDYSDLLGIIHNRNHAYATLSEQARPIKENENKYLWLEDGGGLIRQVKTVEDGWPQSKTARRLHSSMSCISPYLCIQTKLIKSHKTLETRSTWSKVGKDSLRQKRSGQGLCLNWNPALRPA